jgi:hypothetical protein
MHKFEYKVLDIPAAKGWWSSGGKVDFQALNNKLNELGREGWEVSAVRILAGITVSHEM